MLFFKSVSYENHTSITNKYIWSVNFFEIDKNVTNVTIKDAPCEVSDQFLATHMSKYGQVINGSMKRGVIKGTTIENGTRYVQILNCAAWRIFNCHVSYIFINFKKVN
jgi:hypothetical protein